MSRRSTNIPQALEWIWSTHCCANCRHQWQGFKQIKGLRLLNIVQPREIVQEAYRFFEKDVVHWHAWNGDGPVETWANQHPTGARLVIDVTAKTKDEALRLAETLAIRRCVTLPANGSSPQGGSIFCPGQSAAQAWG